MVDSPNNIELNVESKELNHEDKLVDNTENTESKEILDNTSLPQNDVSNNIVQTEAENQTNESAEIINCLALTVKKDYSVSIVKNVVVKSFKNVWRIGLSIFTLNFIKFFF